MANRYLLPERQYEVATSGDVTALLKRTYQSEIETVMDYMTSPTVLDGIRAEETKGSLQTGIREELAHAEQLENWLKQLDEQLPDSVSFKARQHDFQSSEDGTDMLAVIDGVLTAEEDVIETYHASINTAKEANDPVTEDLAVTIFADEGAHQTEFCGFKKKYGREQTL